MDAAVADLVARLEDLTARVEEQQAEIRRLKLSSGATPLAAGIAEADEGATVEASNETTQYPTVFKEPSASRRDLLRYGAVALGTTAAAALGARPANAADGDPVLLGRAHEAIVSTQITCSGIDQRALVGVATAATGTGRGVQGSSFAEDGSGVFGASITSNGSGVGLRGLAFSPNGVAVLGTNFLGGTAVCGELPGSVTANGIAVYGLNNSSYAGPGPGAGGFGVYGLSANGHGLVGATATAGGAAVVGATNGVAEAWAGAFYGRVIIGGDLIVVGGAKSAAVPHPDGSHRQLYCVESPESWFEDFGTGELVDGRADVSIDPGFAAVAEMDKYHVFLTGYDHDHLLHVAKRTPKGFTVEANGALAALQGRRECDLSGAFSWRVVAKRKDITGERLAKVTMPPEPVLPTEPNRTLTQLNVGRPDSTR